jgi:hypothetical protein
MRAVLLAALALGTVAAPARAVELTTLDGFDAPGRARFDKVGVGRSGRRGPGTCSYSNPAHPPAPGTSSRSRATSSARPARLAGVGGRAAALAEGEEVVGA